MTSQIYAYVHTAQYVAIDTKQSADVQNAAAGAIVPPLRRAPAVQPPTGLAAWARGGVDT